MSGNKEKDANMVRAILYAICVSAWASTVAGVIQSCPTMVKMSCFDQLVAFLRTLNDFTWSKVVLAVGSFLFLTSYFYDEWKTHRSSEKDEWVLLGWAFFVVQCATLNCLPCALICGGLGLVTITIGLFFSTMTKNWLWWCLVFENIFWVIGLFLIYCNQLWWSTGIMAVVIILSLIHKVLFRKKKGGEK